jgi:electron transfer flavoprotein beta subunit
MIPLKIIVLIKQVPDTRIPVERVEETGTLKDDWNVPILNPDDRAALAEALRIKDEIRETHITLVHLGSPQGERLLREALALGCDDCLRIWDEDLTGIHTAAKALIFDRVSRILGFDLIFTGTKSVDTGSAQLGIQLAFSLGVPCITRVVKIDEVQAGKILVTRRLDEGYLERVESQKPLVLALEAGEEPARYASFVSLAEASRAAIQCFDLPQVGLPRQAVQQAETRLAFSPLRFPVPKLQAIQAPDSSLPAFERRLRLGEGSGTKHQGSIMMGSEDVVVEELFQILLKRGCLGHLRQEAKSE